jgi:hypothetical protein
MRIELTLFVHFHEYVTYNYSWRIMVEANVGTDTFGVMLSKVQ